MLNEIYQNINPVAFSAFGFSVRWYGIAYILGFIFAGLIMARVAKRWKIQIEAENLLLGILIGIVGIILGARLGYVVFYGNGYFLNNPAKIIAINEGGMSFHGGMIGGLLAAIASAKVMKIKYLRLLDLAFIGVPIGLFFGRCANFINGELWGAPCDLPWAVNFGGLAGNISRHPSQLYEAILEGLIILIVMLILSRKIPPYKKGTYLAIFCILYGVFRFVVEFVREPDSQLGYLAFNWLTMGQLLSIPIIIAGAAILIYNFSATDTIKK